MKGQVVRWSVAFAGTSAMAALLLVSTFRTPGPAAAESIRRRDPAKVSDVELELILNKLREGDLRAVKGELEAARKAWGEARREGEGLWPIHEGLGDSYARVKLFEEALGEYAAAESLVPEKLAALRFAVSAKRAEVHAAAGRPLEAIRTYLEGGAAPKAAARIAELAEKGDREAAIKLVADRAEIHDARLFSLLAVLLEKAGRKGEAAEALGKFAAAVSPWDEALNRRAIDALRAAKRYDPAIEVCRAWVRSTPQAIQAYQLMGDLHLEAGREREAVVAYSSIVDVRSGDAGAHRLLGDLFRKLKRPADAIAQYEAAKKARPEDQVTYSALAALYEECGEEGKAEELMLEANKRFGASSVESRGRLVAIALARIERLKAQGKGDEVRALREKYVSQGIEEAGLYDLKVLMTWDAPAHVDLDVVQADGERVNHERERSKAGGRYYMHNTSGFGPETYTLPKAAPGIYKIGAHRHDGAKATVKFVAILFEGTPREERREASVLFEGEAQDVMRVALELSIP
jgi:tetratricopeptide (TPR) repeat protein